MCWRRCARAASMSAASNRAISSCRDFSTTGDGLIAALQVLAVLARRRQARERGGASVRAAAAGAGECALPEGLAAGRRARQIQHRGARSAAERRGPRAGAQIGHRARDPRHGGRRGREAGARRGARDRRAPSKKRLPDAKAAAARCLDHRGIGFGRRRRHPGRHQDRTAPSASMRRRR